LEYLIENNEECTPANVVASFGGPQKWRENELWCLSTETSHKKMVQKIKDMKKNIVKHRERTQRRSSIVEEFNYVVYDNSKHSQYSNGFFKIIFGLLRTRESVRAVNQYHQRLKAICFTLLLKFLKDLNI
jgi:hypothetical protein